jgi:hypothetical protein
MKKVQNLFPDDAELDDLVVERIRVFYQRVAGHLRELEAYKLKRGYCVGGMSCTRKAVKGPLGGRRTCPHHAAAAKAGLKLRRWTAYESEYGRLRKQLAEQERVEAAPESKRAKKTA